MVKIQCFSVIVCLMVPSLAGMDNLQEQVVDKTKTIKTWDEVFYFRNRLVAYHSNTKQYFVRGSSIAAGQLVDSSGRWQYGCISEYAVPYEHLLQVVQGYNLYRLISYKEVSGKCPLIDPRIKEAGLFMRDINIAELDKIITLMESEKVCFEYDAAGKGLSWLKGIRKYYADIDNKINTSRAFEE